MLLPLISTGNDQSDRTFAIWRQMLNTALAGGASSSNAQIYTLDTRPLPDLTQRGTFIILSDSTYQNGADVLQIWLQRSYAGAQRSYSWVDVALAAS
jgi:hypothetical protein